MCFLSHVPLVLPVCNNREIKIHFVCKIGFPTNSVALKVSFPGLKTNKRKNNNQPTIKTERKKQRKEKRKKISKGSLKNNMHYLARNFDP